MIQYASIFRLAISGLLLTGSVVGQRQAVGAEPISLQQPTTTLRVKDSEAKSASAIVVAPTEYAPLQATPRVARASAAFESKAATPAPATSPRPASSARVSAFTPHYLCLCPPYCPKPEPCVDCCYKCCPDCYCAKPMPCPNPCYKCVCDDYCAKPMPCNFPQPLCGPRAPCRQSEPCPLYAPWPIRGPCLGP